MLKARALVVLPVAVVLALVAVRAIIFLSPPAHPLRALQSMFPGHADALVDGAMREIGASAAKGGTMPVSAHQAILRAARKAPLAPEPFLVEGTIAQIGGDGPRAETLFLAARMRDPRAPAARYFLADHYLRTNRIAAGLTETAALARLSEKASEPLAPALAAYARTPGAVPQLRQFFRDSPVNGGRTLNILAQDPANAELVLALASPLPLRQSPPPNWSTSLVNSLVTAGNHAAAEDVWRRINGIRDRGLLYDPQFRDRSAGPPFNWQLAAGSAGVAEASGGGGLSVIYYGREEVSLASQLLRLPPGAYRLAMRVEAPTSASGLAWIIGCAVGTKQQLLRLPLNIARKGRLSGNFAVPAGDCAVQWIEFRGFSGESSGTTQVTISDLRLDRVAAGA